MSECSPLCPGNVWVKRAMREYVGMGSGRVISGDVLMGYDGVYRAWCADSPSVWVCMSHHTGTEEVR